jgi:hypothetical protein
MERGKLKQPDKQKATSLIPFRSAEVEKWWRQAFVGFGIATNCRGQHSISGFHAEQVWLS